MIGCMPVPYGWSAADTSRAQEQRVAVASRAHPGGRLPEVCSTATVGAYEFDIQTRANCERFAVNQSDCRDQRASSAPAVRRRSAEPVPFFPDDLMHALA